MVAMFFLSLLTISKKRDSIRSFQICFNKIFLDDFRKGVFYIYLNLYSWAYLKLVGLSSFFAIEIPIILARTNTGTDNSPLFAILDYKASSVIRTLTLRRRCWKIE